MKKIFVLLLAAVIFIGFFTYNTGEITAQTTTEYDEAMQKLEEIEKQKISLQNELNNLGSEKSSQMAAKQVIERQINNLEEEMEILTGIIEELNKRIEEKNLEFKVASRDFDEYFEKYKSRIRANYEAGDVVYLEVLLTSKDFSEFLIRMDYVTQVVEYDNLLMEKMLKEIQVINVAKDQIEDDLKAQKEVAEQLETTRQEQVSKNNNVTSLIKELEKDQKQLEAEYRKSEEAEKELNALILTLLNPEKKFGGGFFFWPLPSQYGLNKITSGFGWRTMFERKEFHYAIDIGAPSGTEIYAANDGEIIFCQWTNTGGGNKIVIDHGSGIATHYNHMSKFAKNMKVGVQVKKGDVIGYVGTTGNSTGNHLDFKIFLNDEALNPVEYVTPDGSTPEKSLK